MHNQSRGVVIKLDEDAITATLVREYTHRDMLLSSSQGNMQVLPNGDVFIGRSVLRKPQDYAQIVDHLLQYAGRESPPRLLVGGFSRRQIVWHIAPGRTGAHDPLQ